MKQSLLIPHFLLIAILSYGAPLLAQAKGIVVEQAPYEGKVKTELAQFVTTTLLQVNQLGQALTLPCHGGESDYQLGRTKLQLKFTNDNKFLNLYDAFIAAPNERGDDMGYTHGYALVVERDLPKRLRLTLIASNDLYTQALVNQAYQGTLNGEKISNRNNQSDGEKIVTWRPQYFVEDQKLTLSLDNQKNDRLLFWRVGGGVQRLSNSQDLGPLSTGAQQTALHHAINLYTPISFNERVQIKDGERDRLGLILEGELGLQKSLFSYHDKDQDLDIEITLYTSTGIHLGTIPGTSNLSLKGGSQAQVKLPSLPIIGRLSAEAKSEMEASAHAYGQTLSPKGTLILGNETLGIGVDYQGFQGDLQNYQGYNLPGLNRTPASSSRNDDTATLFMQWNF